MTRVGDHPLSRRLDAIVKLDPDARALEFDRHWDTYGAVAQTMDAVSDCVSEAGTQIGIILRNRPPHVAALLGVLRAGGCVVTINPHRGVERTRADVEELGLDVLVGTPEDLETLGSAGAARMAVALADLGKAPVVRVDADRPTRKPARPGVAVHMLTSGTTGPPKRIELGYELLERVFQGAARHYEKGKEPELALRKGVAIVNSPLVHLGGVFRTLQCVNDGRAFCLLEKFEVDAWYEAVRRHRPATASLVPAALRMVLDAHLDRDELSSLRSVICGTAPLDPADADAFFDRYGIPVLVNYAATEFGGGVAGWNLADHQKYWKAKRGSAGRAQPGCELRVVDEADGHVLGPDEPGLLEVKARQMGGREWVRTTDLARIDADGFLWILGRADQAIIRGGFKVLPDTVRGVLEGHPAVRGACVVGRDDARLGAVPVAAVEIREGQTATVDELLAHAADQLARYEVPVAIEIVDVLPRTDSGKVDLVAVRELFSTDPEPSDA